MDLLIILFVIIAVIAAMLANIAVWSPRRVRVKVGAVILAALFLPIGYATLIGLLSRPKPIELEWARPAPEDTTVLASSLKEQEAIFLWLEVAGLEEPRAYRLPWDEQLARQLHDAQRAARQKGGNVRMRMRAGEGSPGGERMFYSAPPEPLPPKTIGARGSERRMTQLGEQ